MVKISTRGRGGIKNGQKKSNVFYGRPLRERKPVLVKSRVNKKKRRRVHKVGQNFHLSALNAANTYKQMKMYVRFLLLP